MVSTDYVIELYRRFGENLRALRRQQRWFLLRNNNTVLRRLRRMKIRRHLLVPMLDDLEAEITYLFIRDRHPGVVVEMSPNTGWSTTWILSALRDNGSGALWSYDLHDTSSKLVPDKLAGKRWHFVLGDARTTITNAPEFNYLFIDSDHSKEFAEWYTKALLPRVKPGCIVSVHDVYHDSVPSEEGAVVIRWLTARGIAHWTVSPAVNAGVTEAILEERRQLGGDFSRRIHVGTKESMLFFEMK